MALECASVTVASDEGRGPQLPEQTLLATDARGAGSARFTVHSRAAWKPYSTIGTKAVRSLALSSLLRAVRGCGRRHRSASDPNSTDPRPCLLTCSGHRGKRRFVGADLERELHQQLGARLLRSCECRRHLDGRPVSCEHVAQRRCPRSDLGDRGALQELATARWAECEQPPIGCSGVVEQRFRTGSPTRSDTPPRHFAVSVHEPVHRRCYVDAQAIWGLMRDRSAG